LRKAGNHATFTVYVHTALCILCSTQTSALEALLNDVRAHQLKGAVGSGPAAGSTPKQLYTSQMLCNVVTPEQVAAIKRADVRTELVPKVGQVLVAASGV
jgi:hypothetical protein